MVSDDDSVDKKASALPTLQEVDTDLDEELECPFQGEIDAYFEPRNDAEDYSYSGGKIDLKEEIFMITYFICIII